MNLIDSKTRMNCRDGTLALARCCAVTLELLRIHDRLGHGCENRMRRHGMEAARRLDVGWADRFVMRAEIESAAADVTRPADHVQTFAADSPGETFVTARLLDTITGGWSFTAFVFSVVYGFCTWVTLL
jgi:hypothetical protein